MFRILSQHEHLVIGIADQDLWRIGLPTVLSEDGTALQPDAWVVSGDTFKSENRHFVCQIQPYSNDYFWRFDFRIDFKESLKVQSIVLPQHFEAHDICTLTRTYQWVARKTTEYVIDSLTPARLTGTWNNHTVGLEFHRHGLLTFKDSPGQFLLYFDHADTHPRVIHHQGGTSHRDAFTASPERPLEMEARLYTREGHHREFLTPLPWRYPAGKLACFVLTDHADWDTADKLEALYLGPRGINSTHVKTTKSVFYGTVGYETPEKRFQPDGLDVPRFSALADELHQAGHEICPHSIVVRAAAAEDHVPQEVVVRALDVFAQRYASGTWIDHGISPKQPTNYSQLGWNPASEWYLVDLLRQRNFNSLWSYFDPIEYPVKNINQLAEPDDSLVYTKAALQLLAAGHVWESLNYFKFAANLRSGPRGKKYSQDLAQFIKIIISRDLTLKAKLSRLPRRLLKAMGALVALPYWLIVGEENEQGRALFPVLYGEPGLSLGQANADDLLLFSASTVNNLSTAWGNLDALIQEHGIHIGHTYLCATGVKYAEAALRRDQGQWRVSNTFADLLTRLDEKITRHEIWNPTMKECAAWFKTWIQVQIAPIGSQAVRITNPTAAALEGFSLVFMSNVREVSMNNQILDPTQQTPLIYSIDLPPHARVELTWR